MTTKKTTEDAPKVLKHGTVPNAEPVEPVTLKAGHQWVRDQATGETVQTKLDAFSANLLAHATRGFYPG